MLRFGPHWPLPSFDAKDWAAEFMRLFGDKRDQIDESLMIGWFANALMRGYDEKAARIRKWAVERWHAEVANRPLQNVHRRSLDDVWRQVIRELGGDPGTLCGPSHDELRAAPQKGDGE